MEPLFHTTSFVAAMAAGNLLSAIWEGFVLAICVLICLRTIPGLSAASRSVIWMSVLLLLVLLHVFPFLGLHGITVYTGLHTPLQPTPLQLDLRWSFVIAGVWASLSLS